MRIQKASLFVFLLFIIVNNSVAQQAAAVDSLKSELAKATTPAEKVTLMDALSRTLMNVSLPQADEYGKQLITIAEESRDRKIDGAGLHVKWPSLQLFRRSKRLYGTFDRLL